MPQALFTADLHLFHRNIGKYRTQLNGRPNEEVIKENWFAQVGKRDTVYILGDVSFTAEGWAELATWPGRKVIILGNHCTERVDASDIPSCFELHACIRYKGAWLTHIPIHPAQLRSLRNIHGHMHQYSINDPRYMCVSLEQNNLKLFTLDEIRAEFKRRTKFSYNFKRFGFVEAMKAAWRRFFSKRRGYNEKLEK